MLEENVNKTLILCFSEFIKDDVKGIYSQVPAEPLYPYIHVDLQEVQPMHFEHHARCLFSATLVSKYRGNKESQRLIGKIKESFNRKTYHFGSFRIEKQGLTKIEADNLTRKTTLTFTGLLPQEAKF